MLVVVCWRGYLSGARCRLAYGPADATVSCFSKIQIGLPFWYRLTQVVPEKRPLNGCVCALVYYQSAGCNVLLPVACCRYLLFLQVRLDILMGK